MRKTKIVFLLVNGIGFGHFKRSLVIADSFDKNLYDIRFVVQASSTAIFRERGYKVYAFPLLYKVKENNARLIIYRILNQLLEQLLPDVVFEDTHPEDDYLNLPALRNIPRVLIYRRTEGTYLEELYRQGYLDQYHYIFVMESKTRLLKKLTAPRLRSLVKHSEKFIFCGDIFEKPSTWQLEKVREKYQLDTFRKNVVFNCGAGGWHIGNNICKEIFEYGICGVRQLAEDHPEYQFIFITGPYSQNTVTSLDNLSNIRVETYEPYLMALFHCADLCIIRPGYNSVMECLNGQASVLLLPGISYMEEHHLWCEELKQEYAVEFLPVNHLEALEECITRLLLQPLPARKHPVSNERLISDTVSDFLSVSKSAYKKCLFSFSGINSISPNIDQSQVGIIDKKHNLFTFSGRHYPIVNLRHKAFNPIEHLEEIVVLYDDESLEYVPSDTLMESFDFHAYGIIPIVIKELVYITASNCFRKLDYLLGNSTCFAFNIHFDSTGCDDIDAFFECLGARIQNRDVILESDENCIRRVIQQRFSKSYSFSQMELFKLE